ncbi:Ig-like domain-containing protein [Spongiimicrobium salis]|uniref:Ig-like domain-containing protein n=1 Tax=Spongiimicrobium salis TaxID=1667022 RepID=UPI00374DC8F7
MKKNYLVGGLREQFREPLRTLLFFVAFIWGSVQMQAQEMKRMPVDPVVCPASFEDAHSRMGMKQLKSKKMQEIRKSSTIPGVNANNSAEILITFGPGAQGNAEVQAAFQFAIDIWAQEIVSSEPIRISADFQNLGAGVLASAGPTTLISNFQGAPEQNTFYPIALANSLAGTDLAPDLEFDLVVNIGSGIPWYFGTDGNTPAGQFDFVTVALHEMGHGLGFIDGGTVNNATGVGNINGGGNPFIFDTFIVDGDGNSVLDLPNPSVELGDFLTSGDVFVNGPFAVAALGGTLPELFAPNPFQGGSSIAHWDEATFPAGDPNSLMTPQAAPAESNFDIGDITRGHFRDMGWVLAGQAAITVNPNSITAELFVGETLSQDITVTNISEGDVSVTASASEGAQVIASLTPEVLNIALSESGTLTVGIDTADLPGGFYDETVILTIEGQETPIEIPVSIRVLDGTEAPILEVAPTAFDETIEQFQVANRDLTISNPGSADLNFSITVNGEAQETFASRAAKSAANMTAQGFTSRNFSSGNNGLASLVRTDAGTFQQTETAILAEGFEAFAPGELNGQSGWIAAPAGTFNVAAEGAFEGAQGVTVAPNGTGAQTIALSPSITPGDQSFMTASAQLRIEGDAANFEFIPQSPTAGSVNTRVRFNADGSIDVLDAGTGAFVPTGATTPEGFFSVRISIDRDDSSLRVFINDELIHSGTGFAPLIEQIVFLSNNAGSTSSFAFDNLEITDGDDNTFFLTVSPLSGTVPFGGSLDANVRFDARDLEPGEYAATINISSDDPENPTLDVPVTLTVLSPPTISVDPDSLSESVDVQVDIPPTRTATVTISNSGQSDLNFTTALGATVFTPPTSDGGTAASVAAIDMRQYGLGNPVVSQMQSVKATSPSGFASARAAAQFENTGVFNDSIFYDSGINFPDSFGGLNNGTPIITAVQFDAVTDFTLTAVRNAYRTEALTDANIILEIYRGGSTPADGELLLQQTTTTLSTDGIFLLEELMTPLNFAAGENFWVVHSYPAGIDFPQGQDDDTSNVRPDTYFFSSDGGATYTNITTFVFLTRALSGDTDGGPYITLNPASGTVAAGSSADVEVTFNGANLANGVYNTDILFNSNDPMTPTATVATTFEVSGQTSEIAVSDELLTFDNVFLGNSNQRVLTITNNGLSTLNISELSSDNPDFSVDPASATVEAGEELEVTVTFTPSGLGSINGILSISSDADNTPSIDVILNGIGVDPPMAAFDPAEVSATTDAGTTVDAQITLRNDGNSPLTFSFPELAAANALADPNVQLNSSEILSFNDFVPGDKNTRDNRVGTPVVSAVGSDSNFGYTWIDSDEPGGPVFAFEDITGVGTDITAAVGQDGTASGPISFPFEFYGIEYESVFINANGFLSFTQPTGFTFINNQIPVDDNINNVIAVFWDDLEPLNQGGAVHVADFGDRFVVQWTNVNVFLGGAGESATFQVVLYPDGNIDIFYQDVDTASFRDNATVGIENADGSDGAQVVFNADYIRDGLALRFNRPSMPLTPFISAISDVSGAIAAGGSRELTVTLDATELNDGVFFDELSVSSNAPDKSNSTALFELTVIGTPEIAVSDEMLVFEPIFIGLTSEAMVSIENTGTSVLEISELSNENSDFQLDLSAPISLDPGEATAVTVTFAPTSVGEITDDITIVSNDGFGNESITISLSGEGIDPPVLGIDPASLSVTLTEEETTTENITLSNNGGSPLVYSVAPPSAFTPEGTATATFPSYDRLDFEPLRSKQAADNRVGQTFRNTSGGPDSFGYTFVDSNSGGPAFDFIDISGTGIQANVGADGNETVPLSFDFSFYGEIQNEITISANGYVTFSPIVGIDFINAQIPGTGSPNNFIAGMWDDIEPQNGTGVFYEGNSERFIIQYEATPRFLANDAPVTFQIILFPDGSFKMQYADLTTALLTSSTVGIEAPGGTSGLQVIFNNAYLENNLAVTFTPPITGTLAPGESVDIPIEISAEGLEGGITYTSAAIVSSNDPINPVTPVDITLEVLEGPEVASFTLVDADANAIIGPLADGDVIDLATLSTSSLSVIAETGDTPVGSVVFDLNGENGVQTENFAPYTIAGDNDGNFNGINFPLGANTITATPFSGPNGTGDAGSAATVSFTVVDSNAPAVTDLALINADTNEVIQFLSEGDEINLSTIGADNLNIQALLSEDEVGSVVFDYNGRRFTENFAPYALGGDIDGDFRPFALDIGANSLTVTPFSGIAGRGNAGTSLSVNFTIVDDVVPMASNFALVNTETNEVIRPLTEGEVINLGDFDSGLSIIVQVDSEEVGSVLFGFNGNNNFRTENVAPFALNGDIEGDYNAIELPEGANTITATIFTGANRTGAIADVATLNFEVINLPADAEANGAILTPNPVQDVAEFLMQDKPEKPVLLTGVIVNLSGQVVSKPFAVDVNTDGIGTMNVSSLAQGIYVLRISDANGNIVSRIKMVKK